LLLYAHLREEILAAQHPPAPHADQVHAGTARVDECGDHIDIAGAAVHALLILDATQQGDLVAQLGCAFEIERHRGFFHGGVQFVAQRITAPFEKHHRVTYVLGIHLRLDQPDTRPFAAFDLILQARTCAVLEVAVLALPHLERLLQQAEAFANRARARVRPEVSALGLLGAAMNAQPRKGVIGQKHIGVRLIVTQENVVRRPPLLDEGLLQQQCFGFVARDGGFNLRDARHQRSGLGRVSGLAKVTGKTLLEVLGLADIKQSGFGVEHTIDAGATATGREKCTWIECLGHVQALASTMP
ncbi:hypothetical protein ALQ84_101826, partial [Pseudomonas caricapapayae]